MLCRLTIALLLAALAAPLSAADPSGLKPSRIAAGVRLNPGENIAQAKVEVPGGKVGRPPLTTRPKGLESKIVPIQPDLAASIYAIHNRPDQPKDAYAAAKVQNVGLGPYRGGRLMSIYALMPRGPMLLWSEEIKPLKAGGSQTFTLDPPVAEMVRDRTLRVVISGSDQNNANNSASCGWELQDYGM